MTRYRYTGPPSGATIGGEEVLLHPGADVRLPPDNDYTRTLLALGRLEAMPEKAAAPMPPARRGKPEEAA